MRRINGSWLARVSITLIGGHAHPSGNEGSEIALKVLKISHERFVLGDSHGIVEEGGQRIASNFAGAKISEDT